jgi:hypothetical protein
MHDVTRSTATASAKLANDMVSVISPSELANITHFKFVRFLCRILYYVPKCPSLERH